MGSGPEDIKLIFMLNEAENENFPPHKCYHANNERSGRIRG